MRNDPSSFFLKQIGLSNNEYEAKQTLRVGGSELTSDYSLIRDLINIGVPSERIRIPGITFENIKI